MCIGIFKIICQLFVFFPPGSETSGHQRIFLFRDKHIFTRVFFSSLRVNDNNTGLITFLLPPRDCIPIPNYAFVPTPCSSQEEWVQPAERGAGLEWILLFAFGGGGGRAASNDMEVNKMAQVRKMVPGVSQSQCRSALEAVN